MPKDFDKGRFTAGISYHLPGINKDFKEGDLDSVADLSTRLQMEEAEKVEKALKCFINNAGMPDSVYAGFELVDKVLLPFGKAVCFSTNYRPGVVTRSDEE